MIFNNINFAKLYQQQLKRANRTKKEPEHWDKKAQRIPVTTLDSHDNYLKKLFHLMDFSTAKTLFDMGCGPGSVCLNMAQQLDQVYGADYSQGMLEVAKNRAQYHHITNITLFQLSWEDDWHNIPVCDIVVASRSTLVMNLKQAFYKLNQKARHHIYTTHVVSPTFLAPEIYTILEKTPVYLPNYIYAVNILYQMGIYANVDFIRSEESSSIISYQQFEDSICWSLGTLTSHEKQRLKRYYAHSLNATGTVINPTKRDWAVVHWSPIQLKES